MQILEDLLALFSCLDEASMGFNPNGHSSSLTGSVTLWPVGLCFFPVGFVDDGKKTVPNLHIQKYRSTRAFRLTGAHHLSRANTPNEPNPITVSWQ